MNKCCEVKTKVRNKSEKEQIIDRINRISGQLNGIKQMVEDNRYCDDVLTQITAASSSLKSLGFVILSNHMNTCLKEEIRKGNDQELEEVLKLIGRFIK